MRSSIVIVLTLLAMGTLGCGQAVPWGGVSGTILLDKQPVHPAVVLFSNREQGVEATAETDPSGKFVLQTDKLAGLPVGDYVVTVVPIQPNVVPEQGMIFSQPAPMPPASFPTQVQDLATSKLTAAVKEGENNFSFELAQFRQ